MAHKIISFFKLIRLIVSLSISMFEFYLIFGFIPSILMISIIFDYYYPPLRRPLIIFLILLVGFLLDFVQEMTIIRWSLIILFMLIISVYSIIYPLPNDKKMGLRLYNFSFWCLFPKTYFLYSYTAILILPLNVLFTIKWVSPAFAISALVVGFSFYLWCHFIIKPRIIQEIVNAVEPETSFTLNNNKFNGSSIFLKNIRFTAQNKVTIKHLCTAEDGPEAYNYVKNVHSD